MSQPIIQVQGVSKRYELGRIGMTTFRDELQRLMGKAPANQTREFWALRDVSFSVEPGAVVGIIGHNGAGKSTLLKILSRITEPTTGEILLRGRVASLLEVGTGFHPELSGRENIFLNGTILGMKRAEIAKKFDEIVAFSEVGKFIDTPVKRYSSGMYVRLAFAVAAHLEPEILIIDEVLAVGDQAFQQKCLGKMQDVATNGGRTILFVSHHMTAIRRLCKHCLVLDRGVASAVLPVEQAVERYTQSQKVSPNFVSLEDSTRPDTHGRDFRIHSIDIPPPGVLRYGEPGFVDVRFQAKRAVRGFSVGMGFDTVEGQRILTLDTDTLGQPFDLEAGEHCVRVGLDCWPLHPANYRVSVALISGHNFLDTVANAAVWEVLTSQADNVSDRGFGAVRPKPVVQLITG